ncbi:TPA: hypothetical protein HA251_05080 [Candidatus Woesearchaeota archaeon]|nr:hypothetical protein [Candidatus Woesearchaeota archaeon]
MDRRQRGIQIHLQQAGLHTIIADSIAGQLRWNPTKIEGETFRYETLASMRTPEGEMKTTPVILEIHAHHHCDHASDYWKGELYLGGREAFAPSMTLDVDTLRDMELERFTPHYP